ncbi:hypothetical protein [Paraburkholderia fungorum]|uniref:hypothetical protein n=1 Tax=Paraburkholderia fungorum TaxID=134537 RepID=UPI003D6C0925
MLEATFQTRVPFLGEMREPGEVVGGEDLAGVSRTVLDALVAQKIILLNDGSAPGPHDPEAVAHLQARMDQMVDRLGESEAARKADADAAQKQHDAVVTQIEALKASLGEAVQGAIAKAMAAGADVEVSRRREAGGLAITDTTRVRKPKEA